MKIICPVCNQPREVCKKYAQSRHRNRPCLSCSMKKRWTNQEYRARSSESRSISSKRKWQDPEYRQKIISSLPKAVKKPTKTTIKCSVCGSERLVGRRYAQRKKQGENETNATRPCPSCSQKKKWLNPEYKQHMVKSVGENTKKMWKTPEFRKAVTESNSITWSNRTDELSKRALELWQSDEYRAKVTAQYALFPKISSIQLLLYQLLDTLKVDYFKEGPETTIGYFAFDCLIKNPAGRDILIECQGDYWHTLPNNVRRDKSKFTYIDKYFPQYEVMYIWEHEFYEKDGVLDRLKSKLGIELETIDFKLSDIELQPIERAALRSFLDAYHYIGHGRGGIVIGAYLKDILIGCVVFSSPLRQNIGQQFSGTVLELSRFCIHPQYHKKNFASWLIAKSIQQVPFDTLIAYVDTTVGHAGTIYKAANFKLHHTVPADYWYSNNGYVMHKKTLYERAKKQGLKEAEYANKFNYAKIYGGTKLCYFFER